MGRLWLTVLLGCSVGAWAQSSGSSNAAPSGTQTSNPQASDSAPPQPQTAKPQSPNQAPPHSDSGNSDSLNDESGESSSKDNPIDISPPPNDAKAHPRSSEVPTNAAAPGNGDVKEFHPWDPHKAAKDVEVGDFYFRRQNYRAAEDRYREALLYKDDDAEATYRLAVCLQKMDRPEEARAEYENYLRILPHGPHAEKVSKALARMKNADAEGKAK